MIDTKRLLEDLKRLRRRLEDDLREWSTAVAELRESLRREYAAVRKVIYDNT